MDNDDAIQAVRRCFEKIAAEAPHMFPEDKCLAGFVAQKDWREVTKRLIVIRNSLTDQERHQLFVQGRDSQTPAYMAQEVLLKAKFEYLRVELPHVERRILDGLFSDQSA